MSALSGTPVSAETIFQIVDEVRSRQQIQDQLHTWTRGADRIDLELMQSAFHPGANINYGYSNGPVEEFLPWVVKFHSEDLVATSHVIGNVLVKLDGEQATSEAGVYCCLRYKGREGLGDLIVAGRYVDKWARRSGVWRIFDRTSILDWYRTQEVIRSSEVDPWVKQVTEGLRSRADISYRYV
ncbi:MAG TPA: nuclear transport factor 2 family protein [Steroidobacteraceae bacterium]|nr:nuclear transport factor 2 family protein [Steroidobacteraceae bacterium]